MDSAWEENKIVVSQTNAFVSVAEGNFLGHIALSIAAVQYGALCLPK